MLSHGLGRPLRQLRSVEPTVAVDVSGDVELAYERPVGADRDRHVGAADEREHPERVVGRLLECLVAVRRRDADELELGTREREQQRDRVVVPGVAVEDDRGCHQREYLVDLGRGRQGRLRAEARGRDRAGGAGTAQRCLRLQPLEPRDEQAGGERVSGGGAVDGVDRRRLGAGDLLPVLEQDRALGAERDGDDAVAPPQHLELVAVDDGQVGVDVDRPCGRGVEAEEAGRPLPRAAHGLVRDLELRQHGVARRQLEVLQLGVRAGRDRDLVLAARVDEDQRDAGRSLDARGGERQPLFGRQRLVGEDVRPDRADERHLRPEPRAGDGLVRALAALDARKRGVGDRLPRPRQPLDAGDEVEVDAADDGDRGPAHGALC